MKPRTSVYVPGRGSFLLVNSDGDPDTNVALPKAGRKLPTPAPHSPQLLLEAHLNPDSSHLSMGSGCDESLGLLVWLAVGRDGYVSHGSSSMPRCLALISPSSQQASCGVSRPY